MRYHIWTIGCQMNEADSERLARALDDRGLLPTSVLEAADLVIINTCSVRQAAEVKAISKAGTLRALKLSRPDLLVALGGCMVAPTTIPELHRRLPYVDLFFPPADFAALLGIVDARIENSSDEPALRPNSARAASSPTSLAEAASPAVGLGPTRWLPIMNGCDRRCTYCIVPHRRGRETSHPVTELVAEARRLAGEGARELTLLGQIVDRYGHDLPERPGLADLLAVLSAVDGIDRLRFLTSHPHDFDPRLIEAIATLPKICEHVNLPVQAGDDVVLRRMARGYSVDHYRSVVADIRARLPGVSLATDIIVGFSGETAEQFQHSLDLMAEIRFDVVHVAMYSVRPGTRAGDTMPDDIPPVEKKRRLLAVEELQTRVSAEINAGLLDQTLEVLVDGRDEERGRWRGRTRTNKLVFFESESPWLGRLALVKIERAGPWSLGGKVVGGEWPAEGRLAVAGSGPRQAESGGTPKETEVGR